MHTQVLDTGERSKHKDLYSKCSNAKCVDSESIDSVPNKQKIHWYVFMLCNLKC